MLIFLKETPSKEILKKTALCASRLPPALCCPLGNGNVLNSIPQEVTGFPYLHDHHRKKSSTPHRNVIIGAPSLTSPVPSSPPPPPPPPSCSPNKMHKPIYEPNTAKLNALSPFFSNPSHLKKQTKTYASEISFHVFRCSSSVVSGPSSCHQSATAGHPSTTLRTRCNLL